MTPYSLEIQIKSLEAQLQVLRAQVKATIEPDTPRTHFGSLYGILSGKCDFTEEEIDAARYRDNWDENAEE